jgi:hypothetical protein
MIVPCSFSHCSEEFQFWLLWAYCFYHNHSSISKQSYSKEWRNWKWYTVIWWRKIQYISSKLHKKLPRIFVVYLEISRFPKCLTSFFFPQIFGGYLCTHQLLHKQKIKLHFMPCKAQNLKLYPYTLITLDDSQTQNKEFPVVAILLQQSHETLFWRGA